MATFTTRFLGCKVSFADEQAIRERLLADGHTEASGAADVAVINTCCVTNEAVAKSRQAAARAARTHERVYVTGCAANLSTRSFAGLPDNVRVVARPSEEVAAAVAGDVGAIGCVRAENRLDRVRAFVKIQDGCSFSCAFCVIPLVRGATRSRSAKAVLEEIRRRAAQGHREVVLTGVNLGCFRDRDAGLSLAGLIRAAGEVAGLDRLRLSSIEVNHVTADLIEAMRETPIVSSHLHVPLQSGDDAVLRAMGRRYTIGEFRSRIEPLEDFNLTTDVIVGFPTESERGIREHRVGGRRDGDHEGARVSLLAATRHPDGRLTIPCHTRSRRSGACACGQHPIRRASRGGPAGSAATTSSSSIDPGLGYADDYTPWLIDAQVGSMVPARAVGVAEKGVLAVVAA